MQKKVNNLKHAGIINRLKYFFDSCVQPSYLVWGRRQNLRHGHYKYLRVYKSILYTKSIFIIEIRNYFGTSIGLRVQIKDVSPNIFFIFEDLNNFFLCRVLINNKYTFLSATTLLSCFESWKHIYARASHLHSLKHEFLYLWYLLRAIVCVHHTCMYLFVA